MIEKLARLYINKMDVGCIQEGYAQVQASFDNVDRFILVKPLNRYAAEPQSGDVHISFTESYLLQHFPLELYAVFTIVLS
jgi:hypothetical protein